MSGRDPIAERLSRQLDSALAAGADPDSAQAALDAEYAKDQQSLSRTFDRYKAAGLDDSTAAAKAEGEYAARFAAPPPTPGLATGSRFADAFKAIPVGPSRASVAASAVAPRPTTFADRMPTVAADATRATPRSTAGYTDQRLAQQVAGLRKLGTPQAQAYADNLLTAQSVAEDALAPRVAPGFARGLRQFGADAAASATDRLREGLDFVGLEDQVGGKASKTLLDQAERQGLLPSPEQLRAMGVTTRVSPAQQALLGRLGFTPEQVAGGALPTPDGTTLRQAPSFAGEMVGAMLADLPLYMVGGAVGRLAARSLGGALGTGTAIGTALARYGKGGTLIGDAGALLERGNDLRVLGGLADGGMELTGRGIGTELAGTALRGAQEGAVIGGAQQAAYDAQSGASAPEIAANAVAGVVGNVLLGGAAEVGLELSGKLLAKGFRTTADFVRSLNPADVQGVGEDLASIAAGGRMLSEAELQAKYGEMADLIGTLLRDKQTQEAAAEAARATASPAAPEAEAPVAPTPDRTGQPFVTPQRPSILPDERTLLRLRTKASDAMTGSGPALTDAERAILDADSAWHLRIRDLTPEQVLTLDAADRRAWERSRGRELYDPRNQDALDEAAELRRYYELAGDAQGVASVDRKLAAGQARAEEGARLNAEEAAKAAGATADAAPSSLPVVEPTASNIPANLPASETAPSGFARLQTDEQYRSDFVEELLYAAQDDDANRAGGRRGSAFGAFLEDEVAPELEAALREENGYDAAVARVLQLAKGKRRARLAAALNDPKVRAAYGIAEAAPSAPSVAPANRARFQGRADQVILGNGAEAVPVVYELANAPDLIPSHNPQTFAPSEGYTKTIQGRDYQNDRAAQESVRAGAQKLAPELVTRPTADAQGAVVVDQADQAIIGNQRLMMQQLAYQQNGAAAAELRAALKRHVADVGLDPALVDEIPFPVLVRRMVQEADAETLGRINRASDENAGKAMRAVDAGAARARKLETHAPELLTQLQADLGDRTLREFLDSPEGARFIDGLNKAEVIAPNERGALLAGGGKLTPEGKAQVELMIRTLAVGDKGVLDELAPGELQTLDRGAAALARVRGTAYDLGDIFRDAVLTLQDIRSTGMRNLEELRGQGSLLGQDESRGLADRVADLLQRRRQTQFKAFAEKYATLAQEIIQREKSGIEDMFGETPLSRDELLERALALSDGPTGRSGDATVRDEVDSYLAQRRAVQAEFGPDARPGVAHGRPTGEVLEELVRQMSDPETARAVAQEADDLTHGSTEAADAADDVLRARFPKGVEDSHDPAQLNWLDERPPREPGTDRPLKRVGNLRRVAEVLATYRNGWKNTRRGWIDLRGRKVRGLFDLATLMEQFRDPRAEFMSVVLLKNGEIVSHELLTSGAVSHVAMPRDWRKKWTKRIARTGADGAIIVHNHPSGNPTPSQADRAFMAAWWDALRVAAPTLRHREGLVINHGRYTVMRSDGTDWVEAIVNTNLQGVDTRAEQAYKGERWVQARQQIMDATGAFAPDATAPGMVAFFLNANARIVAAEPHLVRNNESVYDGTKRILQSLQSTSKGLGADMIVLAPVGGMPYESLDRMAVPFVGLEGGVVVDVLQPETLGFSGQKTASTGFVGQKYLDKHQNRQIADMLGTKNPDDPPLRRARSLWETAVEYPIGPLESVERAIVEEDVDRPAPVQPMDALTRDGRDVPDTVLRNGPFVDRLTAAISADSFGVGKPEAAANWITRLEKTLASQFPARPYKDLVRPALDAAVAAKQRLSQADVLTIVREAFRRDPLGAAAPELLEFASRGGTVAEAVEDPKLGPAAVARAMDHINTLLHVSHHPDEPLPDAVEFARRQTKALEALDQYISEGLGADDWNTWTVFAQAEQRQREAQNLLAAYHLYDDTGFFDVHGISVDDLRGALRQNELVLDASYDDPTDRAMYQGPMVGVRQAWHEYLGTVNLVQRQVRASNARAPGRDLVELATDDAGAFHVELREGEALGEVVRRAMTKASNASVYMDFFRADLLVDQQYLARVLDGLPALPTPTNVADLRQAHGDRAILRAALNLIDATEATLLAVDEPNLYQLQRRLADAKIDDELTYNNTQGVLEAQAGDGYENVIGTPRRSPLAAVGELNAHEFQHHDNPIQWSRGQAVRVRGEAERMLLTYELQSDTYARQAKAFKTPEERLVGEAAFADAQAASAVAAEPAKQAAYRVDLIQYHANLGNRADMELQAQRKAVADVARRDVTAAIRDLQELRQADLVPNEITLRPDFRAALSVFETYLRNVGAAMSQLVDRTQLDDYEIKIARDRYKDLQPVVNLVREALGNAPEALEVFEQVARYLEPDPVTVLRERVGAKMPEPHTDAYLAAVEPKLAALAEEKKLRERLEASPLDRTRLEAIEREKRSLLQRSAHADRAVEEAGKRDIPNTATPEERQRVAAYRFDGLRAELQFLLENPAMQEAFARDYGIRMEYSGAGPRYAATAIIALGQFGPDRSLVGRNIAAEWGRMYHAIASTPSSGLADPRLSDVPVREQIAAWLASVSAPLGSDITVPQAAALSLTHLADGLAAAGMSEETLRLNVGLFFDKESSSKRWSALNQLTSHYGPSLTAWTKPDHWVLLQVAADLYKAADAGAGAYGIVDATNRIAHPQVQGSPEKATLLYDRLAPKALETLRKYFALGDAVEEVPLANLEGDALVDERGGFRQVGTQLVQTGSQQGRMRRVKLDVEARQRILRMGIPTLGVLLASAISPDAANAQRGPQPDETTPLSGAALAALAGGIVGLGASRLLGRAVRETLELAGRKFFEGDKSLREAPLARRLAVATSRGDAFLGQVTASALPTAPLTDEDRTFALRAVRRLLRYEAVDADQRVVTQTLGDEAELLTGVGEALAGKVGRRLGQSVSADQALHLLSHAEQQLLAREVPVIRSLTSPMTSAAAVAAGATAGALVDQDDPTLGALAGAAAVLGVRGGLARSALETALKDRRAFERLAMTDDLTQLANRRALDAALPTAEADPNTRVVVFDVNGLKQANTVLGQEKADQVLQDAAEAIRQAAIEHGVGERVFRRGGDEFVVLAPASKAEAVRDAAERIMGVRRYAADGGRETQASLGGTVGNTFQQADVVLKARKDAIKAGQVLTPGAAIDPTPAVPPVREIAASPALRNEMRELVRSLGGTVYANPLGPALAAIRASRGLSATAFAAVGASLAGENDDHPILRNTGRSMIALAAIHAIGAKRLGGATSWALVGIRDLLVQSGRTGRRAVEFINPESLLAPEVQEAILRAEQLRAEGKARAVRVAKASANLGPAGDRLVSDLIESETWEDTAQFTPEQLQAALSVAAGVASEIDRVTRLKVQAGILDPDAARADYLPRRYAFWEAHAALGSAITPALPGGRKTRAPLDRSRVLENTPQDRLIRQYDLGEIREASYRTSYFYQRAYGQLAAAHVFSVIDGVPGLIEPSWRAAYDNLLVAGDLAQTAADPADRAAWADIARDAELEVQRISRDYDARHDGDYLKLPETKALGVLSGAVVSRPVYLALQGLPEAPVMARAFRFWKQVKTVFNPATHVGNVMSNVAMAHMAGLPVHLQPLRLGQALKDLVKDGPVTQLLEREGVLNANELSDVATAFDARPSERTLGALAETTRDATRDVLRNEGVTDATAALSPGLRVIVRGLQAAGEGFDAHLLGTIRKLYAHEDNVFRIAAYLHAVAPQVPAGMGGDLIGGMGLSSQQAVEFSRTQLVNFRSRSPLMRAAGVVAPFILYPAKALPTFAKNVIDHPWRYAALLTLPAIVDQMSQDEVGTVPQTELEERDRRGPLGYLAPGPIQIPLANPETQGRAMVDLSRFFPTSSLTTAAPPGTAGAKVDPDFPALLQPSGPLFDLGAIAIGRDPYSGQETIKPEMTKPERGAAYANQVLKEFLPTALGFQLDRYLTDRKRGDVQAAKADVLGYLGMRPRYIVTGDFASRVQFDTEQKIRAAKQAARREFRRSQSAAYDKDVLDQLDKRINAILAEQTRKLGGEPAPEPEPAEATP